MMKVLLSILSLCIFCLAGQAQQKRLDKAQSYFSEGRYYKSYDLLERKVLKHKETKNNPQAMMLYAKSIFYLLDDPDFAEDNPRALQDALKYAKKSIQKDKSGNTVVEESSFLDSLADRAIEEGKSLLDAGKYSRASKYFGDVYEFNADPEALFQDARVSLMLKDTVTAMDKISNLVRMVFDKSLTDTNYVVPIGEKPFLLYVDHLLSKQKYDTAVVIAAFSSDLFPKSKPMKDVFLKAFLLDITRQKPDMAALEQFAQLREKFANDSLFVHKENVLFLYLLNSYSRSGAIGMADSLLSGFISIKDDYYDRFGQRQLDRDPLYDTSTNEFIFNLIQYTSKFDREDLLSLLLRNYVSGNYADERFKKQSGTERWKALFERIKAEKSAKLLYTALPLAKAELKKEAWFKPFMHALVLDALQSHKKFTDRNSMVSLVEFGLREYQSDQQIKTAAQKTLLDAIKEYTENKNYSYARYAIKRCDKLFPAAAGLQELKRNYAKADFIDNYYGSRLLYDTVAGKRKSEFDWKGNELLCDAGKVPLQVQNKVEQRINYFRRVAGVPDYVILDSIKNRLCQLAALIYHANPTKKFTTPAETWKCYNPAAVEAAEMSARVLGQTTVFAVTSLMADLGEKNTLVGNRRWLLYPPARTMGHGSTSNVALIWTLDETGKKDTLDYSTDFISWPPKDYCPAMFAFERWNFSLYADLSKAKVSMKHQGKAVELKQETQVSGYGMPSLVWKPAIESPKGEEQTYEVLVENVLLWGEKKPVNYRYSITFFDPMK